jgi:hypothetical protein
MTQDSPTTTTTTTTTTPARSNTLDPALLDLLRCPLTRSRLRQEGDDLVAETGGLRYPVRDGIPVMLIEEAKVPAPFKSLEDFKSHFRDQIPAR